VPITCEETVVAAAEVDAILKMRTASHFPAP
jgi:hypothetical protein